MRRSLTELPDKWRNQTINPNMDEFDCAAQLEAALPVWTKITKDKSTQPEEGSRNMFASPGGNFRSYPWCDEWNSTCGIPYSQLNVYWRPMCSIDFPQEMLEKRDG